MESSQEESKKVDMSSKLYRTVADPSALAVWDCNTKTIEKFPLPLPDYDGIFRPNIVVLDAETLFMSGGAL